MNLHQVQGGWDEKDANIDPFPAGQAKAPYSHIWLENQIFLVKNILNLFKYIAFYKQQYFKQ